MIAEFKDLPETIRDAIQAVLDYAMPDEMDDAQENGAESHVVARLITLTNWIEGTALTPAEYMRANGYPDYADGEDEEKEEKTPEEVGPSIPRFSYPGHTLADAVDGFLAYDGGCTDSGLHDPDLRAAVHAYLKSLDARELRVVAGRCARRNLTESGLAAGYGVEAVIQFDEWLEEFLSNG